MLRLSVLTLLVAPSAAYLKTSWRDLAANPTYSFADYVAEYGKSYGPAEYKTREATFLKALAEIRAHNEKPNEAYKMGLNKFTDWTKDDMQSVKGLHRGMRFSSPPPPQSSTKLDVSSLPTNKDWRDEKGVVTPTKDQGGCGSCWAFASTETVESAVAIATGKPAPVLSPQELVDCVPNPNQCGGTGGCAGSTEPIAFAWVAEAGMTTNDNYNYTAKTGTCNKRKMKKVKVHTKNVTRLPTNDADALMDAVANVGPIAISVDASWGGYESGVYTGDCGSTIDHAVQATGYGTDKKSGKDYWLVRNSWGEKWGEGGYIRIERTTTCAMDKNPGDGNGCKGGPSEIKVCGKCGMLSDSSYPTGASLVDDE